jgi:hypothetical protein
LKGQQTSAYACQHQKHRNSCEEPHRVALSGRPAGDRRFISSLG